MCKFGSLPKRNIVRASRKNINKQMFTITLPSSAPALQSEKLWAVDFGTQCTLIADDSKATLIVPSVSSPSFDEAKAKFYYSNNRGVAPPSSSSPEIHSHLIGAGTIANQATAVFVASNNSSVTFLAIDPLALATTCKTDSDEVQSSGAHASRQVTFTSPLSQNLLHFAPVGNVSAVIISSDENNNNKNEINFHVGCIKNVPQTVFANRTSQFSVDSETNVLKLADWYVGKHPLHVPFSKIDSVSSVRVSKNVIIATLISGSERHSVKIEQNNLTEQISSVERFTESSKENKTLAIGNLNGKIVPLTIDEYRPLAEECCFCMMNLLPEDDDSDEFMPAVCVLGCGHGYHRGCLDMDLTRVDDFVKDGRYFRFRRLACSICSSSMKDALRFGILEPMFVLRDKIGKLAAALDAKSGGSAGDDEPLEDRLKRHLFYSCSTCKQPFYGGPYDCGATLSDPKTRPENLICDECIDDFNCATHGRSNVVYKCQNCWNPALADNKRFLGRLRLCSSCFNAQKGKPAPADDITPVAVKREDGEVFVAPEGTPFAFLGKNFAAAGHDKDGVGLSVAGCSACNANLVFVEPKKNEDAAEK